MKTIVIGAGKVGYSIAQMLSQENHDVTVIEQNPDREQIVAQNLDVQTILGNGASINALKKAGVTEADLVIAVTEKDEFNMVACLIAKSFGVLRTMARVEDPEYAEITKEEAFATFDIDSIINPDQVTAQLIAKLIEVPQAVNVEYYAEEQVQILELKLPSNTPLANIPLKNLDKPLPFLIVAILRGEKMMIPKGDDVFLPGDYVFAMSETHKNLELDLLFGIPYLEIKNIAILGGGRLGIYLASALEKNKHLNIKIIEKDLGQCNLCSKILSNTLVLHGDGTDMQFLNEEDIGSSDLFIATTSDDKVNLLVCLLTKHLGAKRTIAQIRRSEYTSLVEAVGVDIAVSPRTLTAGAILKFIGKGDIISVTLLGGAKARLLEFAASETTGIIGKPLQNIRFPKNAIIGSIVKKNQVIVPKGNSIIEPGDHVMVFALPDSVKKAEKLFI
ncbi:MAG: Trk system potassium transporter TrkA [Bacillota bacterium]